MIELLTIALLQAVAGEPAETRTERICTREPAGGSTRIGTTRVCRDVPIAVEEAAPAAAETPTTAAAPVAETEVRSVVEAGVDAFNRRDLDAFMQKFDANAELYAFSSWVRGSAAIRDHMGSAFQQFPNARLQISELKTRQMSDDTVAVDYAWSVSRGDGSAPLSGVTTAVYLKAPQGWREVLEHRTMLSADNTPPRAG